jgi:hypothetical protein
MVEDARDGQAVGELFSYVVLEARVRRDYPLRAIRVVVNDAPAALERAFAALYACGGAGTQRRAQLPRREALERDA